MFKTLSTKRRVSQIVRGLFVAPITWEDRLQGRKWIDFAGQFQSQRWGNHDSNSCWALSCVNSVEDQLEFLAATNQFSKEAMDFFKTHGFIDSDGDFSISERYIEILGGQKDSGGTSAGAWQLLQRWGCIPRSMLTYSASQANKWQTSKQFSDDYFSQSAITGKMMSVGVEFKKYVNIAYQTIGKKWTTPSKEVLRAALCQAPICVGIPIPTNVFNWNVPYVTYDGNTVLAHEVELHDVTNDGTRFVSDQYTPPEKHLSPDYPLYIVTQGIVYSLSKPKPITPEPVPVPTPEQTFWVKFWSAVNNFWNGISNSTPIG